MKEPSRLLEDPSISPQSRALLRAGGELRMAADRKRKVWAGISAATAAVSVGSTAGATLAKVGASALGTKVVLGVMVLGAFGSGAVLAVGLSPRRIDPSGEHVSGMESVRRSEPKASNGDSLVAPLDSVVAPPETESPVPVVAGSDRRPAVVLGAGSTALEAPVPAMSWGGEAPVVPADTSPALAASSRASQLREESAAVAQAREALQRGRAGDALRILNGIADRVPSGMLIQEREKIAIEALAASGQREAARNRAAAFLARYPGSAHAAAVRPFAQ